MPPYGFSFSSPLPLPSSFSVVAQPGRLPPSCLPFHTTTRAAARRHGCLRFPLSLSGNNSHCAFRFLCLPAASCHAFLFCFSPRLAVIVAVARGWSHHARLNFQSRKVRLALLRIFSSRYFAQCRLPVACHSPAVRGGGFSHFFSSSLTCLPF